MRQLVMGILIGSALTGSLTWAGQFYNKDGSLNAPAGSQKSFDYFRERQQFLDIGAMRRNSDEQRLKSQTNPCGK